jgi:hypothetical protein
MNCNIKKAFFVLVLFVGFIRLADAQQVPTLSEESQISVITFGPYQGELWSAFGHSGVRVYDPLQNINWMYDWGRFDFDQKNFYWNFARGKMLYSIGRTRNFERYKEYYEREDRYIYEQVLNLTLEEKQAYFQALEVNYLPENKEYFYNYVYDNCATRIYDMTAKVLNDSVDFPLSFKEKGKSVRDLMDDYLAYQPWGDFAIDIALATQIDGEAPANIYLFLPDYIYKAFAEASIVRGDRTVPLVSQTNKIYEVKNPPEKAGWFTPFNVFLLLFFVVGWITNRDFKKQKRTKWIDYVLFTMVGIVGWWFIFLWFGTEHLSKGNWNLLWAFPLHIPLIYLAGKAKLQYGIARVYRFLAVLLLLVLIFWFLIPQPLHPALVPLLITLILRSFYISYDLSRI